MSESVVSPEICKVCSWLKKDQGGYWCSCGHSKDEPLYCPFAGKNDYVVSIMVEDHANIKTQ